VVVISRKNFEHDEKPSVTHQFDAGAAWENLALQGRSVDRVSTGILGMYLYFFKQFYLYFWKNIPTQYPVVLALETNRTETVEYFNSLLTDDYLSYENRASE